MGQDELSPEIYKQALEFLRIGNRAAKRAQKENQKKASQMSTLLMGTFTMNCRMGN
jgi:hypothetical protein